MLFKLTSNYRFQLLAKAYAGKIPKNATVLDIGCGNGFIASKMSEIFGVKVTGCDVLNYLKVKIPFFEADVVGKLPSTDKKYSIITYNDMLHHVPKKHHGVILKEGLRVASTVLIFEDIANTSNKIIDVVVNIIHERRMRVPLAHRSEKEWIQLFERLNLNYSVIKVQRPFFYPLSHIAFILRDK